MDQITRSIGGAAVIPQLDLPIHQGEFLVLVGPSRCGKTTSLRMLAVLEALSSGRISIAGRDVTHARPGERDIAMVFQDYAPCPSCTAWCRRR